MLEAGVPLPMADLGFMLEKRAERKFLILIIFLAIFPFRHIKLMLLNVPYKNAF